MMKNYSHFHIFISWKIIKVKHDMERRAILSVFQISPAWNDRPEKTDLNLLSFDNWISCVSLYFSKWSSMVPNLAKIILFGFYTGRITQKPVQWRTGEVIFMVKFKGDSEVKVNHNRDNSSWRLIGVQIHQRVWASKSSQRRQHYAVLVLLQENCLD